jgi:hypothetical protein
MISKSNTQTDGADHGILSAQDERSQFTVDELFSGAGPPAGGAARFKFLCQATEHE